MKKLMLVAAMVLGFAGMSFAQSSGTQGINMSVDVISALTFTSHGDMSFGPVGAGTGAVTLNPASTTAGQTAGYFTVNGQSNQPITVTYTPPTTLISGTNSVPLSLALIGFNTNTVGSATGVSSGTQVTLDATSGDYYFWLGGTVTVASGQAAGTYTGTFTLQVAY